MRKALQGRRDARPEETDMAQRVREFGDACGAISRETPCFALIRTADAPGMIRVSPSGQRRGGLEGPNVALWAKLGRVFPTLGSLETFQGLGSRPAAMTIGKTAESTVAYA